MMNGYLRWAKHGLSIDSAQYAKALSIAVSILLAASQTRQAGIGAAVRISISDKPDFPERLPGWVE